MCDKISKIFRTMKKTVHPKKSHIYITKRRAFGEIFSKSLWEIILCLGNEAGNFIV